MRISDLVKKTRTPKETIHFYVREGILPKPKKSSRTQAKYNEEHIDKLELINELKDGYFLPLSTIKAILSRRGNKPIEKDEVFRIRTKYSKPMEQLFPETVQGEIAFIKITGMNKDRLSYFEDRGIILPSMEDGEKIYSHEDIKIGKCLGDLKNIGITVKEGFPEDGVGILHDKIKELADLSSKIYWETLAKTKSSDEIMDSSKLVNELNSVFLHHLYQRLFRDSIQKKYEKNQDSSA